MQIRVQNSNQTVIFQLNDSSAAKTLYDQLPLSLKVENYGSNEKIFYPPNRLNTINTPSAAGPAGTLAYFEPWGNVVMYYRRFGAYPGLYELGHAISGSESIENLRGEIKIDKLTK